MDKNIISDYLPYTRDCPNHCKASISLDPFYVRAFKISIIILIMIALILPP